MKREKQSIPLMLSLRLGIPSRGVLLGGEAPQSFARRLRISAPYISIEVEREKPENTENIKKNEQKCKRYRGENYEREGRH